MSIVMQVIQFRLAGLSEADYRAHTERVAPVLSALKLTVAWATTRNCASLTVPETTAKLL